MSTELTITNTEIKIRHIEVKQLPKIMMMILSKAFAIIGQEPTAIEMQLLITETIKDIQTKYKSLTLMEIENAIIAGAKGDWGDYYGMNNKSVNQFLRAYIASDIREQYIEANKKKAIALLPEKTPPTLEDYLKLRISNAVACFENFKNTFRLMDFGNSVYDFLKELNLIVIDDEDRNRIWEEAKAGVLSDLEFKKANSTHIFRRSIDAEMKKVEDGQGKQFDVIREAKTIALTEYFGSLLDDERELADVISETLEN